MRVVLSPNPYRDKGLKAAQAAKKILENSGIQTVLCLPFPVDGGAHVELPRHLKFANMEQELSHADMLVCFGGDGTILHAANDANAYKVPILGVNMGSVGFMAELEYSELSQLANLATGKFTMEKRMMMDVKAYHDGKVIYEDLALNDAVITKGAVARVLDLAVFGDGVLISDFSGDGVIVSTPTGSTAYSMSAGGPIVEPTAQNIIFTPICAHALHARSFVLDHQRLVTVRTLRQSRKLAYLSVDGGKAVKLSAGDFVEMRQSESFTQLVKLNGRSFYDSINQKLGRA
ncbi:MAG: NAD(+)/NADH kinase [Oscillospiraceae bacterium]